MAQKERKELFAIGEVSRIRFRGTHADSPDQYRKLLNYIEEHQLQIAGFSREITLIDYGITNDPEKFLIRLIRSDAHPSRISTSFPSNPNPYLCIFSSGIPA